jgi:transcriptional regulator GlxA family with amidase domain
VLTITDADSRTRARSWASALRWQHAEALNVYTVAEGIGVAAEHLAHLFPAELCMKVKEFVTKVRIEVAKQLLYDRSYRLEHIAEQVGFSDASHLSRVFRRFAGHRPGNYRLRIMRTYRTFGRRDHNGSIDT